MARWWVSSSLPESCLRSWSVWTGTDSRFPTLIFYRLRWHQKEGRYEHTADRGIFLSHRTFADCHSFHAADGGPGLAAGKNQASAHFDWKVRSGIESRNSEPSKDIHL